MEVHEDAGGLLAGFGDEGGDGGEGVVEFRAHEGAALGVDDGEFFAVAGDDDKAAAGGARGVVEGAQEAGFGVEEGEDFLLVPGVVAEGDDVGAAAHEFDGQARGDAVAAGAVFAVDDDEVGLETLAQFGQCALEGLAAGFAHDVADEEDGHGRCQGVGCALEGLEEAHELLAARALGLAHVVAAGGDAELEGLGQVAAQEAGDAEAGVEVVACAGGDFGLFGVGACDADGVVLVGGDGVFDGVDDGAVNGEFFADFGGEGGDHFLAFAGGGDAEVLCDLEAFAFVHAEDDVAVFLEFGNSVECDFDVGSRSFGGITEVEEEEFAHRGGGFGFGFGGLFGRLWQEVGKDFFPNGGHVGEHGPVDHPHEAGGFPKFFPGGVAEFLFNGVVGDVGDCGVFADHEFAVEKFDGVGLGGIGDAVHGAAFGEFVEDRVSFRVASHTHVGDGNAEGGQGEGHDGAVASVAGGLVYHLKGGRFASGFGG